MSEAPPISLKLDTAAVLKNVKAAYRSSELTEVELIETAKTHGALLENNQIDVLRLIKSLCVRVT